MSEEAPTSWKEIKTNKLTLGLIGSLIGIGLTVGIYGSTQLNRLGSLEEQLNNRTVASINSLAQRLDAVEDGISGLQQLRTSDLSQTPKSWEVDGLHDRLMAVELFLEDWEEEE
tara:strand:+ start:281 stop:622 length:342 start_codon:yes stop_codon:yes gene_type:complete